MTLSASGTGFGSGFDQSLSNFAQLLPKVGYFLLILIVGLILGKIVSKIIVKVLQRVGFDKVVERGGVKKALAQSKYDAATLLGKIVYYFIFLLVLSAAFGVFGPNPVSDFLAVIVAFLPNLFVAVLVIVIAAAVAAAVKDLLTNMLGGLSYGATLANAVSLFIIGIGVFFALNQLHIAPLIVGGIFYALLALIVIPPIIAFGVGGIDPAREIVQDMRSKGREKREEVKQEVQAQRSDDSDSDSGEQPAEEPPARRTRATSTRAAARSTATTTSRTPSRRRPTS